MSDPLSDICGDALAARILAAVTLKLVFKTLKDDPQIKQRVAKALIDSIDEWGVVGDSSEAVRKRAKTVLQETVLSFSAGKTSSPIQ